MTYYIDVDVRRALVARRHPIATTWALSVAASLALIPAYIVLDWDANHFPGAPVIAWWIVATIVQVCVVVCSTTLDEYDGAWGLTKSALAHRATVKRMGADARVIEAQPSGSVVRLYETRTTPLPTGEVRLERIHTKTFDAEAESDACQAFVSAWRDAEHARRLSLGDVSDAETSARALAQSINDC